MKYQAKPYTCGPAAIANAMRLFGLNYPEEAIAALADTTAMQGTDDKGMVKALKLLNCKPSRVALTSTIRKRVLAGIPVIVHIDEEEHWVLVIGVLGDRLVVFDSERSKSNVKENGIRVLSPGKKIFGICVDTTSKRT